jgi:hypothetical protein
MLCLPAEKQGNYVSHNFSEIMLPDRRSTSSVYNTTHQDNMTSKRQSSSLVSTRHTKHAKFPPFSRWNELPVEIWAKTFTYLPKWFRPLVSATCRSWYSAIELLHVERLTCEAAAAGGYLGVLKWAREHGCPWNVWTCIKAAEGGHLEVLQWAREHGCPWNEETCSEAARGGQLEVLRWAREHGCPWNERTCAEAASGGHLELLRWAREHGCPWDKGTCQAAAKGGHLEVLQWAREHGCPE